LFVRGQHHNVTRWYDFITVDCGLKRKAIAWSKDNKAGITREFNGDELVKIVKKIDLPNHFPNLRNCQQKQQLWKDFYQIYISLPTARPNDIEHQTSDWATLFNSRHCYKGLETPYIHAFGTHLHEMATTVGDVSLFTQQGKRLFIFFKLLSQVSYNLNFSF
jgi:hypothetical protein